MNEIEQLINGMMSSDFDDDCEMVHIVCNCNSKIALCGKKLGNGKLHGDDVQEDCVVCHYMDAWACPRCGE